MPLELVGPFGRTVNLAILSEAMTAPIVLSVSDSTSLSLQMVRPDLSGVAEAVGMAAGVATAAANSATEVASAGAAQGLSIALSVGATDTVATGASDGVATASAIGAADSESAGAATATSTAASGGASDVEAAGNSAGSSTAAAGGDFEAAGNGTGLAEGQATASAVGVSEAEAAGAATGSAAAGAVGEAATFAEITIETWGPQAAPHGDVPVEYTTDQAVTVDAVLYLASAGDPTASSQFNGGDADYIDLGDIALTVAGSPVNVDIPDELTGDYKLALLEQGAPDVNIVTSTGSTAINTVTEAAGAAAGAASVAGAGASEAEAAGASAGAATAGAVGDSVTEEVGAGASAGATTVSGAGASDAAAAGSSAGAASAAAVGDSSSGGGITSFAFVGDNVASPASSSHTFVAEPIEGPGDIVVAVACHGANIATCEIGGVPATVDARSVNTFELETSAIFRAAIPSGTAVDIFLTFTEDDLTTARTPSGDVAIWVARGVKSGGLTVTDTFVYNNSVTYPLACDVDTAAGGAAVGVMSDRGGGSGQNTSFDWVGLTKTGSDYDLNSGEDSNYGIATSTTAETPRGIDITEGGAGSAGVAVCVVSYE